MNEVKRPQKPLIYYYCIVMIILMLFNFLAMPWISQRQIQEPSTINTWGETPVWPAPLRPRPRLTVLSSI